jgi:uncharacterized membrane protein YsdA (DUF1294 family)
LEKNKNIQKKEKIKEKKLWITVVIKNDLGIIYQ